MGELLRLVGENGGDTSCIPFPPSRIADLVALIADGVISSGTGKQVLSEMWSRGDIDPSEIVDSKGWRQVSDTSAIDAAIQAALDGNPDQLEQYRAGKTKLRGFFVGQVMRAMKGKANPQLVQQRLDVLLEA
jgi:aspartyl-tRNA(Asn)/glutamyl-tRNA(Gln) amidotransferase subunit B